MAYDRDTANRIREQLSGRDDVTEKSMFGALCFMLHGNMAVAAEGEQMLMVRCPHDQTDDLIADGAQPMLMHGRPARGWVRVKESTLSDEDFDRWVGVGVSYADSLPPK